MAVSRFWLVFSALLLLISAVNGLNVNNHSNYVHRRKVGTTSMSDDADESALVAQLSNKL